MDLQRLWLNVNGVALSTDYLRTMVRSFLSNWLEDLQEHVSACDQLNHQKFLVHYASYYTFPKLSLFWQSLEKEAVIFSWQQIDEELDLDDFYEKNFPDSSASSVIGSKTSSQARNVFRPSNGNLNLSSELQLKEDLPCNGIDSMAQKTFSVSCCLFLNCWMSDG